MNFFEWCMVINFVLCASFILLCSFRQKSRTSWIIDDAVFITVMTALGPFAPGAILAMWLACRHNSKKGKSHD